MDLDYQQCMELFLNGLKVSKGISLPERNILHNIDIHDGCIIINVNIALNEDHQFPYPSQGAYIFS